MNAEIAGDSDFHASSFAAAYRAERERPFRIAATASLRGRSLTCLLGNTSTRRAAPILLRLSLHSIPRRPTTIDYQRHRPEQTLLHEVVRENLEDFIAGSRERAAPVARFVERELRAYLACGVLAHGFLRLHCDACGRDRLLAFSCKGRAVCPSCGGRRMAGTAAHLVDRVIPEVPVRQWVLTLPYPLRYRCAWDARLTSEVLRAFLRALFADQRRRARLHHGVRSGSCGAVTAIQRFGSALNLAPHFHTLLLDGIYPGPAHTPGGFLPLPPPETEDVARVMTGTARRIMRLLEKRGLQSGDDSLARDDPLLATLMAASVRSRIATGPQAGQPWRRLGDRVEQRSPAEVGTDTSNQTPARCVRHGGMSLHADVSVPARDRKRLERLARYVLRQPLALERLEALPDGRLSYRLKTRWRDGTTHILMERHELLERLAPLIPPPRAHQVRYHGILAPCASGRDRVVPGARRAVSTVSEDEDGNRRTACPTRGTPTRRTHEVKEVEIEASPHAGLQQKIATTHEVAIAHCDRVSRAPRAAPSSQGSAPTPPLRPHRVPFSRARRLPWADLLKRVFGVDALRCQCGNSMRVLAAITDLAVARRVLTCMALPARAPPLNPARAPSSAPAPWLEAPAEDFDQTPPGDWEHSA